MLIRSAKLKLSLGIVLLHGHSQMLYGIMDVLHY
jgi:hypothetical protein